MKELGVQEKERRDQEKRDEMEKMREWNKPRDDLDCDDLKDLPRAHPIRSRVPDALFGEAVMVLEYINCCMSVLFNVQKQFSKGISIGESSCLDSGSDRQFCPEIHINDTSPLTQNNFKTTFGAFDGQCINRRQIEVCENQKNWFNFDSITFLKSKLFAIL